VPFAVGILPDFVSLSEIIQDLLQGNPFFRAYRENSHHLIDGHGLKMKDVQDGGLVAVRFLWLLTLRKKI
jgi:hypothetical protein